MKLKALLNLIKVDSILGQIDPEIDLVPTTEIDKCTAKSILFMVKKICGDTPENTPSFKVQPYAIITDRKIKTTIPIILTENARSALAHAFKLHYFPNGIQMKIVGVTGTNGKTTTATIIHQALLRSGSKPGLIGTGIILSGENEITPKDYTMTTPDPSLLYKVLSEMQTDGCEIVVMEVSSHSLALCKVEPIEFELGIFTNLSAEHLDFHKSIDEYFLVKSKLFNQSRLSIFNIDDQYGKKLYTEHKGKKLSVGIVEEGLIYATDIKFNSILGSEFFYRTKDLIFKVRTKLPGPYNIYNALLALAACIELGIKPCAAKKALNCIERISGRMEIIHRHPTVIIDYAHTPAALESMLKFLRSALVFGQSLIVVIGCGGDRDKSKRGFVGQISAKYADKVVITEDNSRTEDLNSIIEDIVAGIEEREKCVIVPKRSTAISMAISLARDNDVVAIVGKGHERYIIDNSGMRPFDERAIVAEHFGY